MSLLKKIRRSLKRDGILGTTRLILANLAALPAEKIRRRAPKTWFDEQYGVDTDTWVSLGDLEIDSPNYIHGVVYAPISVQVFRDILNQLPIDHSAFTFLDLGSGKGRALLLAAGFPFRRIVGVEFSPDLNRVALKNLEVSPVPRACHDIACICQDATLFVLPNEPLVILLYNPFIGEAMITVLQNIEASLRTNPRDIFVVYVKPLMVTTFRQSAELQEVIAHRHYSVFKNKYPISR